jgi:hypothetical protein
MLLSDMRVVLVKGITAGGESAEGTGMCAWTRDAH